MTGIGPVEPYDPDDAPRPRTPATPSPPGAGTDTLGSDSPRLPNRWATLPARRRRLLALGAADLTAGPATATPLLPANPRTPTLGPWPAPATHLRHDGPAATRGTFPFTVRVARGCGMTPSHIRSGTAQLAAHVTPATPFTAAAQAPRALRARITVRSCAALPRALDKTHLDATPPNRRDRRRHRFLLADRHPHALLHHSHPVRRARETPPGPMTPAARTHTAVTASYLCRNEAMRRSRAATMPRAPRPRRTQPPEPPTTHPTKITSSPMQEQGVLVKRSFPPPEHPPQSPTPHLTETAPA
ncbi:hypothetical protein K377_00769 [Streptomyces sp. PsTaAH-137]|nr:hypothetical protein K377_00769 [Streptomyces sp. PsTaAH-137]